MGKILLIINVVTAAQLLNGSVLVLLIFVSHVITNGKKCRKKVKLS